MVLAGEKAFFARAQGLTDWSNDLISAGHVFLRIAEQQVMKNILIWIHDGDVLLREVSMRRGKVRNEIQRRKENKILIQKYGDIINARLPGNYPWK